MAIKPKKQTIGLVIVAAGKASRMNGTDKILAVLAGKPVLLRTLEPFLSIKKIDGIVIVLNRSNFQSTKAILEKAGLSGRVITCLGGKRRQDSTLAGVKKLRKCDIVLVHDGARPLITPEIIGRGIEAVKETGCATAAVPVKDTIKLSGSDNLVEKTLDRDNLWHIQTPQVFNYDLLMQTFKHNDTDVLDDAQLVEKAGGRVKLYSGAYDNIKITTPEDLIITGALLKQRNKVNKRKSPPS
jgi:2-C-methyl-D-erythritol 4-phosphate cytidylyltransferase